jgi:hypothetical protein
MTYGQGLMTFSSLEQALRFGFHVYDRTESGYLVRTKTAAGWVLAIVDLKRRPR